MQPIRKIIFCLKKLSWIKWCIAIALLSNAYPCVASNVDENSDDRNKKRTITLTLPHIKNPFSKNRNQAISEEKFINQPSTMSSHDPSKQKYEDIDVYINELRFGINQKRMHTVFTLIPISQRPKFTSDLNLLSLKTLHPNWRIKFIEAFAEVFESQPNDFAYNLQLLYKFSAKIYYTDCDKIIKSFATVPAQYQHEFAENIRLLISNRESVMYSSNVIQGFSKVFADKHIDNFQDFVHQLFPLFVSIKDSYKCEDLIEAFAEVPINKRQDLVAKTQQLLSPVLIVQDELSCECCSESIKAFTIIPFELHDKFISDTQLLFTHKMYLYDYSALIKALAKVYAHQPAGFVEEVESLLKDRVNGMSGPRMIEAFASVPINQRYKIMAYHEELLTDEMDTEGKCKVIKTLAKTLKHQPENFISDVILLVLNKINDCLYTKLIEKYAKIPINDRPVFKKNVFNFIKNEKYYNQSELYNRDHTIYAFTLVPVCQHNKFIDEIKFMIRNQLENIELNVTYIKAPWSIIFDHARDIERYLELHPGKQWHLSLNFKD